MTASAVSDLIGDRSGGRLDGASTAGDGATGLAGSMEVGRAVGVRGGSRRTTIRSFLEGEAIPLKEHASDNRISIASIALTSIISCGGRFRCPAAGS